MGRQAYLTKIALGRSAFEPAQTTESTSECVQQASAQQQRAHEHGRRLREAQNDVLASIGVVERRRSPSQGLPGSYEERIRAMEDEEAVGNTLAFTSSLTENACTWWIRSIRERILTYRYPATHAFTQIVAAERDINGKSLIYAGFASRLFSRLCIQGTIYGVHILRPLERLLQMQSVFNPSKFYRRWKTVFHASLRISLELLFYPFSYLSYLQRLGLAPAETLFPSLISCIPFSNSSPLLPISAYPEAVASPAGLFKAILTSPFVIMCVQHFFERWLYSVINEPIETMIIHPTNPDIPSPAWDNSKNRTTTLLGYHRPSPKFIRNAIYRLLTFIGWAESTSTQETQSLPTTHQAHEQRGQVSIQTDSAYVGNPSRSEEPSDPHEEPSDLTNQRNNTWSAASRPPSAPMSPTISQASHNDNDPRIRITTRGNLVEMEVRLPPHVISSQTELAESGPSTPGQDDVVSATPTQKAGVAPFHRVTQLSLEPAQMLGAICKTQIVGWVSLPLRMVTLRLVAAHYFASHPHHTSPLGAYRTLIVPSDFTWNSLGVHASRLALCGMTELAIDFVLWGCQYWTVTWFGTRAFDWAAL